MTIFFANTFLRTLHIFCEWSAISVVRFCAIFCVICAKPKFLKMSEFFSGVNLWYFKCLLLLVECIWLKYKRSLPTEIKTTIKLSHQICHTALTLNELSQTLAFGFASTSPTNWYFLCRPRHIHFKNAMRLFLS